MHTPTAQPNGKKRDLFIPILVGVTVLICAAVLLFNNFYKPVLKTLDSGDFRFELCGRNSLAEIRVYYKEEQKAKIRVTSPKGEEGVVLDDLNDDGYPDLLVQRTSSDKNKLFYCWIWSVEKTAYLQIPALNDVYNPTPDPDHDAILSHYTKRVSGFDENDKPCYEETEYYSVYRLLDGVYTEVARYAFTYYSESDIYSYAVSRYDEESASLLGALGEDQWMSPSEAEAFDFTAKVYADLEER